MGSAQEPHRSGLDALFCRSLAAWGSAVQSIFQVGIKVVPVPGGWPDAWEGRCYTWHQGGVEGMTAVMMTLSPHAYEPSRPGLLFAPT